MQKFFNTAGPMKEEMNYCVAPLNRWDLDEIMDFIYMQRYFILHAPRQTGKTTCILALRDKLNAEGKYFAVYINVETGQSSLHDDFNAMRKIVPKLIQKVKDMLHDDFDVEKAFNHMNLYGYEDGLQTILRYLTSIIQKPIVLFIDEIDALIGDTLISVLRQLRSGYNERPAHFPSTVVLCGLRDIKDYRIRSSKDEIISGGSCFNVKAESLRLGNFTNEDVIDLYSQHTTETGQVFAEGCIDLVMEYTDGQPWLVNALAHQVTYKMKENRDRSVVITTDLIKQAKESLILARQTHLDQLVDKLSEDRVRSVILPMILGQGAIPLPDDIEYCIDLGLIKRDKTGLEISNEIYKEIIPRELSNVAQTLLLTTFSPSWVNPDGSLNINTLLTLFKDFWNKNAGIWSKKMRDYEEAAPQLLMQAFLQRVINGGGYINREYGLERKRTDLFIEWHYTVENKLKIQNTVMELKVMSTYNSYEALKSSAIIQTTEYAKICGESQAHIIVFDNNQSQNWGTDTENEYAEQDGVALEIWKLGSKTHTGT